ncbi:MAG: cyclodeaminase/cyclohydrolase family protein [Ignavibacteria bacterium]|jgi:formiminotetrahydrofolate cyclodeaminase|nr:cyclodeaminase/cyclohydrolase family protein [Ignavibacteria bacterium]MDP3831824.1 cyclodeaminase/cyclohydrolase family protein [Ignavibacteriaceae bacterium]
MNLDLSIKEYITDLSSNSPTPGGGNVAALCGVLSTSLGMMMCNLTIGKKKYLEHDDEMKELLIRFSELKDRFAELAIKDNEAFDKVMAAFKLPKETDEQKTLRINSIENATVEAAQIPFEVIVTCDSLLPLLIRASEIGNQNSMSDIGVAISLVNTASEGAFLNVVINCSSLNDRNKGNEILTNAENFYTKTKSEANNRISDLINNMRLK